jgi:broad specificity phosphatase PhoE
VEQALVFESPRGGVSRERSLISQKMVENHPQGCFSFGFMCYIFSMNTVYFVRHGSTPGNEGNVYQHPDTPLSENGIEQAKAVARRFESIKADVIISSDMSRAITTAEEISKHNNTRLEINSLFKEILRPSVVRGKSTEQAEVADIMDQIKANWENPAWHHSDEENFYDLKERGMKALEHLYSRKEDSIIVVSHGHYLRMLIGLIIFGDDLTAQIYKRISKTFYTANTGITMCTLFEGKLSINTWNDYEHLGESSP